VPIDSIAHGWFPVGLQLTASSYLSPFSKYLMSSFSDHDLQFGSSDNFRCSILIARSRLSDFAFAAAVREFGTVFPRRPTYPSA